MSKAIIILEDQGGSINVKLEFDPPARAHGRISGAQWLAGEMLKVAAKILEQCNEEEEDQC